MNTDVPKDVWDTFDGMDFVIYLNEFRRIVEGLELTSVKTYSWRLTAPRLYNHNIGYFEDLHNAQLKINRLWLKEGKDDIWWQAHIRKIMETVASWTKRIFYMNEYEEKEDRLAAMRRELQEKGIDWGKDEAYQAAYRTKLKYES